MSFQITGRSRPPAAAPRPASGESDPRGAERAARLPSTHSASTPTTTAPVRSSPWLFEASPSVTSRPSPPAPTSAAIVAVATTCTEAIRTPVITSGIPSGSSTWRNTCQPGHAHPPRRVPCLGVDLAQPDVGVGDQRRQREQHERDDRRGVADPDRAQRQQGQHGERRDRAADVGEVDRERCRHDRDGQGSGRAAARSPSRSATATTVSSTCCSSRNRMPVWPVQCDPVVM